RGVGNQRGRIELFDERAPRPVHLARHRRSSSDSRAPSDRVRGDRRVSVTLTVADTAYSIAAVRAEERDLFDDAFAKHFVAEGAHAREGTERYLSLPFFRDGVRLRTRYIDDALREA